jgi:hypothetical protein
MESDALRRIYMAAIHGRIDTISDTRDIAYLAFAISTGLASQGPRSSEIVIPHLDRFHLSAHSMSQYLPWRQYTFSVVEAQPD